MKNADIERDRVLCRAGAVRRQCSWRSRHIPCSAVLCAAPDVAAYTAPADTADVSAAFDDYDTRRWHRPETHSQSVVNTSTQPPTLSGMGND